MDLIKIKRLITFLFIFSIWITSYGQKLKKDNRNQIEKEDGLSRFNSDKVNELDILHALDFLGVQIHKFSFGEFKSDYSIDLILDEYSAGNLVKSDTMMSFSNRYHYYIDSVDTAYEDYINQLKIITKTTDNSSILRIQTYAMNAQKEIALNKLKYGQFFTWREYKNIQWKLNTKTPILIFASSWYDGRINRFCGVVKLTEGEKATNELLNNSPNYFIISYSVTNKKEK